MINYSRESIYDAKKEIVRAQVQRFHIFYSDYFNREQTIPMVNYFFETIYNLDGRDEWIELAVNTFEKVKHMIKDQTRENVQQLIELNNLTDKLDTQMAYLLLEKEWEKDKKELNLEEYTTLYRELDHYQERKQQLEVVLKNMELFYTLAHRPINSVIMKPARFMAKILGVYPLFATVEEGYHAILPVSPELFQDFYKEVKQKEWEYLHQAFPEL
ncbi:MAG: hypothetical protein H7A23_04910 [Leptospiraceae bacterium]|nr:hypothetical protein [Leptospiraceae bacterium]MCP5493876.1 hypothetical protein [Leptospiraceae bacterium]